MSQQAPPSREQAPAGAREPIAIVGIGCRLPGGADSPARLWQLLSEGFDAIAPIPAERLDLEALYDERPATPGKMMTRWGGLLPDVDRFDADFFGISPREAERLDPQQRLLLEVTWEALADAGIPADRLRGSRTGVFVGMWLNEFESYLFAEPNTLDLYMTTGSGRYSASGRVSYFFDLYGPSLTIDTACSSSLVAVHLACQSLWSGECQLALAGGANVILQPHITIAYSQARMMAPDGHCKFGDAAADGYVRSDGAALVVLKPLSAALAAGDPVYAVIRGSAVTNDGRSSGFLATPGQAGQEEMLRRAYAHAGIDPRTVQYVEAHGTGTSAGDPVELGALGAVLGAGRPPDQPCLVGSIKTNIGHTEGAAGVVGMIKAALALRNGQIPASLHLHQPNPRIPWDALGVQICAAQRPWPAADHPARAGVSSFGIAGTNAHVVLEAPPAQPAVASSAAVAPLVLPISAHTPAALNGLARAYLGILADRSGAIDDLCYSASLRAAHLGQRLAIVAGDRDGLDAGLAAFLCGEQHPTLSVGQAAAEPPRVAFVFPGQGSQWLGMARELLAGEPAFRAAFAGCDAAIRAETGWSPVEQLLAEEAESRLGEIDVIQPTLFAVQVALAALWQSWGVEPAAVVGHSMGEVAAAHVAGALSLEDAVAIICRRSRLLRRVRGQGAMAVVGLSFAEAQAAIAGHADRLAIAVSNGPRSTVLSGDPAALAAVVAELERRDVFCRPVKVDVASHSPQMDPLLAELEAALAELAPNAAHVPIYSTVEGAVVGGQSLGAAYWARNLRRPVLFATAAQQLAADGHTIFIEISPDPILLVAIEQVLRHSGHAGLAVPSLRRNEPERTRMLTSLGALYTAGVPINWAAHYLARGRFVALPAYPWQRERYWYTHTAQHSRQGSAPALAQQQAASPLLGRRLPALAVLPGVHIWEGVLEEAATPAELRSPVDQGAVLAGGAYVWMALRAAGEVAPGGAARLRNLVVLADLPLEAGDERTTQAAITPGAGGAELRIYSRGGGAEPWVEHASALLDTPGDPLPAFDLAALQAACVAAGPTPPGLDQPWYGQGEALARLRRPEGPPDRPDPGRVTAGLALLSALGATVGQADLLVAAIDQVTGAPAGEPAWAYACIGAGRDDGLRGDVSLLDEDGRVLLRCAGVTLRRPTEALRARVAQARLAEWLYELAWRPLAPAEVAPASGPGRWLLFADAGGLATELAGLLAADGAEVTLAYPGAAYERLADGGVRLDPTDQGHMSRLVAATAAGGAPATAVYLWGLDLAPADAVDGELLLERQRPALAAALHLAQALARTPGAATRLWLLTRGAVPAGEPAGALAVEQAALWGLGRVVASEHPELGAGLIDVDAGPGAARALYAALQAGDAEDQVALRNGARLGARIVRGQGRMPAGLPPLRSDATYLITGGLGGVGLVLARWMLANGARSLALLGRRPLDETLAAAIGALAVDGAEVVYFQADVAQRASLAAALGRMATTMPPLRGVVHAAGSLDDAALLGQSWAGFERVMGAKLAGAWNLHQQTLGLSLDLFVLCSSVSALLGTPGQANYAAANAFLDALAHHRRAAGLAALSINWGRWGEVGLATQAARGEQLERRGLAAMSPAAAAAAFGRLLGGAQAQAAVMDITWATFVGRLARAGNAPILGELDELAERPREQQPGAVASDLLRAIEQAEPAARYELLLEHVRRCVAEVLRFGDVARVAPGRGFFQLGLDSLTSLELKNRLGRDLGRALPATLAFDYPTAAALARQLLAEFAPAAVGAIGAPAEPEHELAALAQLGRDELKQLLDSELDAIDF